MYLESININPYLKAVEAELSGLYFDQEQYDSAYYYSKDGIFEQSILKNTSYSIIISNTNNLSDTLTYFIKVIADEFPKINLYYYSILKR